MNLGKAIISNELWVSTQSLGKLLVNATYFGINQVV